MDGFQSFIPLRTFFQNVIPIKHCIIRNSKGTGKAFLVKIKNRILLQTITIF